MKCALSSCTFAGGRRRSSGRVLRQDQVLRSSCLFVMGRESGYRERELGLGVK